jgi:uncharacterized protein (TIGR03435 family)
VGKNGSKLEDAKDGRKNYINWTGVGAVTFTENQGLLGLINILSGLLGAQVVDQTNLKSSYNFALSFADPRILQSQGDEPRPDLVTAVREQLGLELQGTKGPVDVLVLDHIERPSSN